MNVSDPIDALYIAVSYWYAPLLILIAIVGLLFGIYKGLSSRSAKSRLPWGASVLLCAGVIFGVPIHVAKTYAETEFFVLLGSESDRDAEQAYKTFGPRISLKRIESVILHGAHSDNCRFYLAVLLADRLE